MKRLALLLLLAASPLDQAARDRLAATERTAAQLRRDSADASTSSTEARRRALQSAASLVTLAARVQASERRLAKAQRSLSAVERKQAHRREALAAEQKEATRLLAVLQTMARRPTALALIQPGNAPDIAHTRMALDTIVPDLRARTASLRAEMAAADAARQQLVAARDREAAEGAALALDRATLARAESTARQDAVGLSAKAVADRRRSAQLAREAVSLRELVTRLASDRTAAAAPRLREPVVGDIVAEEDPLLPSSMSFTTLAGAQVVAPAPGRVAFAGPFRSYGGVVIVDHGGGWRSILSGLAGVSARAGQIVAGGAPLARMPAGSPRLHLELRNRGGAIDPFPYLATACRKAAAFAHKPGRAMQGPVTRSEGSSRIEDRCRVSS